MGAGISPTLFRGIIHDLSRSIQDPVSPLSLTLPCDDRQAGLLRVRIRDWCGRAHLGADLREDALIIASELFSNAVRAAATATTVGVLLIHERDTVTVSVANSGPPFALADIAPPSAHRAGGRGIAIARTLGAVFVEHSNGITVVRVVLVKPGGSGGPRPISRRTVRPRRGV